MTKSILLEPIETPNGETNAYEIISYLLEETSNDVWDSSPDKGKGYLEALGHLNQLMEQD